MNLEKKLKKYNQQHLFYFEKELSLIEKKQLQNQLKKLPFYKMKFLYKNSYKDKTINNKKIKPIVPFVDKKIDKNYYCKIGEKFVGNFAIITLSGGSGSRFGYKGAKGTYTFEILGKNTSMFKMQADKLLNIAQKYKNYIPWLIMTSEENDSNIKSFFEENHYFNYPKEKIFFFSQTSLPILSVDGNFVLKNKCEILKASCGNGEIFKVLKDTKILNKLEKLNIKYVQVINVDNLLVKMFDPIFIGLMYENKFLVGAKTIYKEDVESKDYTFCLYKNHPFLYNLNNIVSKKDLELYRDMFSGISIFDIKALNILKNINLQYHRAYKNYNYYDTNGEYCNTKEKNAFKFEKFIFDGFWNFKRILLYRIDKTEEFYPVKDRESLEKFIDLKEKEM